MRIRSHPRRSAHIRDFATNLRIQIQTQIRDSDFPADPDFGAGPIILLGLDWLSVYLPWIKGGVKSRLLLGKRTVRSTLYRHRFCTINLLSEARIDAPTLISFPITRSDALAAAMMGQHGRLKRDIVNDIGLRFDHEWQIIKSNPKLRPLYLCIYLMYKSYTSYKRRDVNFWKC